MKKTDRIDLHQSRAVSEFVRDLQNLVRGSQLAELAFTLDGSRLVFGFASYKPILYEVWPANVRNGHVLHLTGSKVPSRVEHLLVLIRTFFAGRGFDTLKIEVRDGGIRIFPAHD